MLEQRRKPKNTEIYTLYRHYRHIPSKFWHTVIVQYEIILYKLFTAILELSDHLRHITLSGLRVEQESNLKTADH